MWPFVRGGREAYPGRRPFNGVTRQDDGRHLDRGDLVAARIVAKENSIFKGLIRMQRTSVLNQYAPSVQTARVSRDPEPALSVVTVYQDPLTRHWATELWERVGQLISNEAVCHQSWKMSDLTDPRVFMDAVRAAEEADVLLVAVRDTGELPIGLFV